jgi:hypothetical protein
MKTISIKPASLNYQTVIAPPEIIKEILDGEAAALKGKIEGFKLKHSVLEDSVITAEEATELIEQAELGLGVSRAENLLLQDLFVRGAKESEMYTNAMPELADDEYYLTADAERLIADFFVRHPLLDFPQVETRAFPECAADPSLCAGR